MQNAIQKIKTMFQMQKMLNNQTNGLGWEKGVAKNGKVINWKRAAILELAENIESLSWKHWKDINASGDYENVKIETVDTWHFIMSEILSQGGIPFSESSLDNLLTRLEEAPSFHEAVLTDGYKHTDTEKEIQRNEDLIKGLVTNASAIELLDLFIKIVPQAEMNINDLYTLYIGKNTLNTHRQENGYKTGEYIKIWGEVEDNVVMQEILNNNPDVTPLELKNELQKKYDEVCLESQSTSIKP